MSKSNKKLFRLKSSIVGKLILYTLIISTLIIITVTSLQVYLDYKNELKSIHIQFEQIKSSFQNSIINSLWITDDELLEIQLEGILRLPDIEFVEVRKGEEVIQAVGILNSERIIEKTMPLLYTYNKHEVNLGELHIVASLKAVRERIANQIHLTISIEAITILLVSFFIFIFFYQMVSRHIISMASFTKSIGFKSMDQPFRLDRKSNTKKPDELDQLITSFNLMRKNLAQDIDLREIANKAVRTERDNLNNIFKAMNDSICIINEQYDIQYANPIFTKKLGEYNGIKCYEYFHNRKKVCSWCKHPEVFSGKTVHWEWHSKKDKKTYHIIDTPIKNSDGSISKLEILQDITKRKNTEEELIKHREQLEELVKERTAELEAKNKELEHYNKLFAGREFRIKELKDIIKKMKGKSEN
jgi:PAS domain-containing protein